MKKIRNLEQLNDEIDREFAWRRKELSIVASKVRTAKGKNVDTELRCAVLLLYAHWEGFVKSASTLYLNYVSGQGHLYSEMAPCFIAIKLKERLNTSMQTNKASVHSQVVSFIINDLEQKAQIPYENIIHTYSNLKSQIFKEIILTVGLDYTPYETKDNLIDESLLKRRNDIAHGEYMLLTVSDFDEIFNEITNILNHFKNDLQNAAALKWYLHANSGTK